MRVRREMREEGKGKGENWGWRRIERVKSEREEWIGGKRRKNTEGRGKEVKGEKGRKVEQLSWGDGRSRRSRNESSGLKG